MGVMRSEAPTHLPAINPRQDQNPTWSPLRINDDKGLSCRRGNHVRDSYVRLGRDRSQPSGFHERRLGPPDVERTRDPNRRAPTVVKIHPVRGIETGRHSAELAQMPDPTEGSACQRKVGVSGHESLMLAHPGAPTATEFTNCARRAPRRNDDFAGGPTSQVVMTREGSLQSYALPVSYRPGP